MVDRIFKLVQKGYTSVNEAAIVLGSFSLFSQLLGLFRDRSLASLLGPSKELDIYYAAFRVPDFLFISIASLASITVLLPFLVKKKDSGVHAFFSRIWSAFMVLLVILSVLLYFAMPKLAPLIAPGFDAASLVKLVHISRIMLLSPILLGASNMLASITQLYHKFFIYALSPVLYNAGIIFGIVVLYPTYGIAGIAAGVVFGALLHLLIQLPTIIAHKFLPKFTLRISWREIWEVVHTSLPRTLGLAVGSITTFVLVSLMSKLATGSISVFTFAYNLQTVPVGIIGISYAVASFPTLVQTYANNEIAYVRHVLGACRTILFWSLPFAVLFIVFRAHIVRIVLGSGSFSWNDTRLVAAALGLFAIGVISQNVVHLFVRAYYAKGNTKLPLLVNIAAAIVTIAAALLLQRMYMHVPNFAESIKQFFRVTDVPGAGVLVFPIAFAAGSVLNALALFFFFCSHLPHGEKQKEEKISLYMSIWQSIVASVVMGVVSYGALATLAPLSDQSTFWGIFSQALVAGLCGAVAWITTHELFGDKEYTEIKHALKRALWKTEVVVPEQENV